MIHSPTFHQTLAERSENLSPARLGVPPTPTRALVVIASGLRTLARVTDLVCQVHSVDPPHAAILRSIELVATEVAPALGWQRDATAASTGFPSLQTS